MSEELILKACQWFQSRVDTIIKKKKRWPYWINLLYCVHFFFVVNFFELKLILFYHRVVYYHTKLFLIFLLHPVLPGEHRLTFLTRDIEASLPPAQCKLPFPNVKTNQPTNQTVCALTNSRKKHFPLFLFVYNSLCHTFHHK